MKRIWIIAVSIATLVSIAAPSRGSHQIGHTDVFTKIGAPGNPEGIIVRDGIAYVGTHTWLGGGTGGPASKIFRYDATTGAALGSISATGQNESGTHGLLAMAFDAAGRLYVLDRNPARVLRFDLTTSTQSTYATIPELEPCSLSAPPCSPTAADEPPFPDYLAFDATGNLYVSDLQAATIYRVSPGGGAAQIWFQDARLDGVFGPNGITIGAEGFTFAMTGSQQPDGLGLGILYRLPLVATPTAADLHEMYRFAIPASGPDGFAIGASGRVYVALAGINQVAVLEPDGPDRYREVVTFPSAADNAQLTIPYDMPASVAFDGNGNILVTNHSFFTNNANNWAVLRAWVNDTARTPIEPSIPG